MCGCCSLHGLFRRWLDRHHRYRFPGSGSDRTSTPWLSRPGPETRSANTFGSGVIQALGALAFVFSTVSVSAVPLEHWFLTPLEDLDLAGLSDRTYFFPANQSPEDPTLYLPLRRWDLIFTGDRVNTPGSALDQENVNRLIPSPFNHLMVYLGKDARGMAYAVELNMASFDTDGGIGLIPLGADYGLLESVQDKDIHNRRRLLSRWAMRFRPEARALLQAAETELIARLVADFVMGFPYQLEFRHSGSLFDAEVHLIDDGFTGGAGCTDYWTTLFESYAGLCLKGVRMSAEDLEAYFREDPEGQLAYAPAEISPFTQPLTLKRILELGFRAVEDQPHVFPCDGSTEAGLVLPMKLMQHPLLEEITPAGTQLLLPSLRLGGSD